MKKLFLVILFVVAAMTAFAQVDPVTAQGSSDDSSKVIYLIIIVYIVFIIYAIIQSNRKELVVFYDYGDILFVMFMMAATGAAIYIGVLIPEVGGFDDSSRGIIFVCILITAFIAFLLHNVYVTVMYNNRPDKVIVALIARITLSLFFALSVLFMKGAEKRKDKAQWALIASIIAATMLLLFIIENSATHLRISTRDT